MYENVREENLALATGQAARQFSAAEPASRSYLLRANITKCLTQIDTRFWTPEKSTTFLYRDPDTNSKKFKSAKIVLLKSKAGF